jgi:hypothetical protein
MSLHASNKEFVKDNAYKSLKNLEGFKYPHEPPTTKEQESKTMEHTMTENTLLTWAGCQTPLHRRTTKAEDPIYTSYKAKPR